ncbi:hypothetical protein [Paenibacillus sp. NPDC055715]
MSKEISIYGQVHGYERTPIHMIKVCVYQDEHNEVSKTYTNEEGKYQLSVPSGTRITVRFDTHVGEETFARKWHPSVVANIEAKEDLELNRFLMLVGTTNGLTAEIDALTA